MSGRAGTVELTATINDRVLYFYMVPGCCALRSCGSFNKATPEEICRGIVESGISGNIMVMVDAYTNGGRDALRFKQYVEDNGLGAVTISQGINNQYTDAELFTVTYEYNPSVLAEKFYGDDWSRPEGWYSRTDKVWMDDVFYSLGGRPKDAEDVKWKDYDHGY